jgi:YegS/Rv2252/BmrU family lipid kinase
MKCKTACLIINPRLGKKINDLSALIAVLSAAGWKTDIAIKEFGGHTRRLAKKAAEAGYDLVIGFGGDGTLNQVLNGVMAAERRGCIVGVIPGGTANVWAHEIGIAEDPIKASLLLVNSEACRVDVGHVEFDSLPLASGKTDGGKEEWKMPRGKHHFLLMAGLGMDAAIMRRVPTSLKERIGRAAVALAALRTLPSQHAFPVEIWSADEGAEEIMRWSGRALQVIVGNTRRYGNIAELTPHAFIDDGALDVCVITGDPLGLVEQIFSMLLNRNARNARSKRFRATRFWIKAPASIDLQLDGSRVKLDDGVEVSEDTGPKRGKKSNADMVTYRFDALPRALSVAIPSSYNGKLFEKGFAKERGPSAKERNPEEDSVRATIRTSKNARFQDRQGLDSLLEHGRKVTVVGVTRDPERKTTYIVAGVSSQEKSGTSKPVAVRIDHETTLVGPTGDPLPIEVAARLLENSVIVVEGKQSKRSVIRAKRVVVVT